ncbi:tRNA (uracil(54)-C(5))-methyltransferase -B [Homalodisca vitripennis]|nr:tRNA (uracil(54)-C(5))-methyltransferase -B [Homalodisca vitripennis]
MGPFYIEREFSLSLSTLSLYGTLTTSHTFDESTPVGSWSAADSISVVDGLTSASSMSTCATIRLLLTKGMLPSHPHVKCSRDQATIRHLSGQAYLKESMCDLEFRISPDSFFQLNKHAAEILFQKVVQLAGPKHYTTLLDLYCGTGAMSLLFSPRVRGCVGVELGVAAVEDAKHNAQINNITNCTFVEGRVEEKLFGVLKNLDHSPSIIAVVNPGRGGAGESAISLLRQHPNIHKVIYVSCKPDNPLTMKNFVQLCERVGTGSKPFHLTKAIPFDLFPYTDHRELVLCFEKR